MVSCIKGAFFNPATGGYLDTAYRFLCVGGNIHLGRAQQAFFVGRKVGWKAYLLIFSGSRLDGVFALAIYIRLGRGGIGWKYIGRATERRIS